MARLAPSSQARVAHLSTATRLNPESSELRTLISIQLETDSQIRLTVYELKEAARLAPDNMDKTHDLAEFLVRDQQSMAALGAWKSIAARDQVAVIRAALWVRLLRQLPSQPALPPVVDLALEDVVENLAAQESVYFEHETYVQAFDTEKFFWILLFHKVSNGRYAENTVTYNPAIFAGFLQALTFRVKGCMDTLTPTMTEQLKTARQLPLAGYQLDAKIH
jgi:hypothetical protein